MSVTGGQAPPGHEPEKERKFREGSSRVDYPFGNLAIPEGPMALRPTLADGLPLSRNPWLCTAPRGPDRQRGHPTELGVIESDETNMEHDKPAVKWEGPNCGPSPISLTFSRSCTRPRRASAPHR